MPETMTLDPRCEVCRGACCETMTLTVSGQNSDLQRWLELRSTPQLTEKGVLRNFKCPCSMLKDGRCIIYDDRPQMCKDFEPGGKNCLSTVAALRTPEQVLEIFGVAADVAPIPDVSPEAV